VLFEVSLAIFKLAQKRLLLIEDPVEMIGYLHELCSSIYDGHSLFQEIQMLTTVQIETIRQVERAKLLSELKHKEEMRAVTQFERSTSFGVQVLRDMNVQFDQLSINTDPSDRAPGIDYDTFCALMHDALPSSGDSDSGESSYSRKLFDAFDVNKSNSVNFKALMCGLSVLSKGSENDKIQLCFDLFSDENGTMGKRELGSMLGALYSIYYHKGFEKEVSFFVDMIFQEADKNSDGRLSGDEFMKAAHMQPFIVKCFRLDQPHDLVVPCIKDQKKQKQKEKEDDMLKDPEEWVVM